MHVVDRVQRHGAVIRVDRRLDGVADVGHLAVDLPGRAARRERVVRGVGQRDGLRVGVVGRGGVRVDDPQDPSVDNGRVRLGIGRQERCGLLHPLDRIPVVQDLGVRVDLGGEQEVRLAVLGREHRPLEQVSDTDATGAGVGVPRRVRVVLTCDAAFGADDRVVGGELPVVGPRLADRDVALLGQVGNRVIRVPVGHRVRRRGNETVAVGEHHVLVDPVLLRVVQSVSIQLSHSDDIVLGLTVHGVAIHRQLIGKTVEVPQLLLLGERRGKDIGIEQTRIRHRVGVRDDVLRIAGEGALVVDVIDLVVANLVRGPGRIDIPRDVLGLTVDAVGVDDHLLQHQRPHPADQHAGEHQQAESDRGQLDGAGERPDDEPDRTDRRDQHQDELRRQHRVDVGVRRTGEGAAAVGEQQLVPVVPVLDRLQQHERGHQQRQLQRRLRGDLAARTGQPDAAEQVLHHRDADETDGDDDEQPPQDQLDHRQREDIKADVVPELRVHRAEIATVEPQLNNGPVRLCRQAADQGDDAGDSEGEDLRPRGDDRAVRREWIDLVGGDEDRPGLVGQIERQEDQPTTADRGDQEHDDPADRLGGEDLAESHLAEPEPVDVDADELKPQDPKNGQADQGNQHPFGAFGHRGQTDRGPHGHG